MGSDAAQPLLVLSDGAEALVFPHTTCQQEGLLNVLPAPLFCALPSLQLELEGLVGHAAQLSSHPHC